jgi:hypothetical protein
MGPTRTLGEIATARADPRLRYGPALPPWPVSALLSTSEAALWDIVVAMGALTRCTEPGQAVP